MDELTERIIERDEVEINEVNGVETSDSVVRGNYVEMNADEISDGVVETIILR